MQVQIALSLPIFCFTILIEQAAHSLYISAGLFSRNSNLVTFIEILLLVLQGSWGYVTLLYNRLCAFSLLRCSDKLDFDSTATGLVSIFANINGESIECI